MLGRRKKYFINPKFQARYISGYIFLGIFVAAIVSVITAYLILFYFSKDKISHSLWAPELMRSVGWFVVVMVIFVFVRAVLLSHRIAGPAFRFEKTAEFIANGNLTVKIKLRKNDELHQLAGYFNSMVDRLRFFVEKDRKLSGEITNIINSLASLIDKKDLSSNESIQEIMKRLEEIKNKSEQITSDYII